jgi:hypothetical protein
MKKYLMKGVALLGATILTVSCSHDAWFQTNDATQRDVEEYASNFKNVVMGGQNVDSGQTWNTAVTTQINLTSAKSGIMRVFTVDPLTNVDAAYLAETKVSAGTAVDITISKPSDVIMLYAAVFNEAGNVIDVLAFDATESTIKAQFYTSSEPAGARAARRIIKSSHTFTTARPDDSDYAMAMPTENIYSANEYYAHTSTITNYYLPEGKNHNLNPYNGNAYYYIDGERNLTFINPSDAASTVRYYILPGANVHFTQTFSYKLAGNHAMYVAPGAIVTFDQNLSAGVIIYNQGTVIVEGMTGPYNNGGIYNQNILTCKGGLHVFNAGSEIINEGTLNVTGGDVTVEGSGHILNVAGGHFVVNNNTIVNSNDCTWQNDGDYHTGNFNYTAGSPNVINNCKLTVDDTFYIDLGDNLDRNGFKMDAGAGVVTEKLWMDGPSYIWMGAQSVFQVNDEAKMDITKDIYGIYGPKTSANGYAVFHADKIVMADPSNPNNFMANYFNYLVVAYDTYHFPQGYLDGTSDAAKANGGIGSCPHYHLGENAIVDKVSNLGTTYDVESGTCNPGFKGSGGKRENVKSYTYFAFEDLGTSDDFDFNDVVVRVSTPDENNVSTVELCAIGGTLKQKVFCDNIQIGEEVHEYGEFGDNTKRFIKVPLAELGTVNVPEGKSPADLNINIQVTRSNGEVVTVAAPKSGETPFRVVVSGDDEGKWFWSQERKNISDAYTQFGKWGADMDSNPDWYKYPVNGNVVKW